MGRGVRSSGGGESQLGYLFGSENPPWPKASGNRPAVAAPRPTQPELQSPAGLLGRNFNNYHRADGQNTGNFITDRPSTKVHAAPGGGSSLGYLFGGGN
ncbi:unnamed protein product [Sphagnum troendelagicum]|uniref:Uncharacterized protein n=2 Tax=Sphagnum TaxID=13804 RepID=A0ABP0V1Y3_9BRYO